jgi:enamine deaminase RidA (YjgF/YER057c/UK114 family)
MSQPSRQHISTGSPFEPKVGISRAVRAGNIIAVTGTAPLSPEGKTVAKGDAAAQARRCLEIIESAIEGLVGKLSHVTRTRILLTRIEDWELVAAVHGEFFASIRPANTIMQVVRFIDPDWLVEIEVDAVVEGCEPMSAGAILIIAIAATEILLMRFGKRRPAKINIAITNRITGLFAGWLTGVRYPRSRTLQVEENLWHTHKRVPSAQRLHRRPDLQQPMRVGEERARSGRMRTQDSRQGISAIHAERRA